VLAFYAVRLLLLGENGQLGFELRRSLSPLAPGNDLLAPPRREVDLSDLEATRGLVRSFRPTLIVNASAYTDVDRAEKEPEAADLVNARLPAMLGEEAKRLEAGLIHFSTDFVFDGTKGSFYVESDRTHPLGEYARSKLAGENALLAMDAPAIVFRTAWVYSLRRKSFVTTMLRLARENDMLKVVSDQVGSPTFCRDLADGVAQMLRGMGKNASHAVRDGKGIYHLSGAGSVSRYDFARAILALDPKRHEQKVRSVVPIRTEDFPLPAKRPLATPLDCTKASMRFGVSLIPWERALAGAFAEGP
jgi:dTDP-4-dehydrorhamnose reductase